MNLQIFKSLNQQILKYWQEKPLLLIILLGSFFRLLAALFSKGFGMQDDHFLVIEAAQSWIDKTDYNKWLPIQGNHTPPGHSFFYPGLHYIIFLLLKYIRIINPQTKMYIIRLLHAAYSVSVIYFGFKITEKVSDKKTAALTGLLLSLYWFMPYYSVRNLVEMVCIPLLMWRTWLILTQSSEFGVRRLKFFFLAGLILGIAFCIRYQTIVFTGGIILVLLMQKKRKESVFVFIGTIFTILLFEGGLDYFVWGYPFAELREYVKYNLENAYSYLTQPWYHYIIFITGVLLPPVSIFILFGYLRAGYFSLKSQVSSFKVKTSNLQHLSSILQISNLKFLLFLPSFLFLLFHSYFPNKQERFILSIIPFIIIMGMVGWNDFLNNSKSNIVNRNSKIIKGCWVFFWVINLTALPVISTWYSRKARVESMTYLYKYKNINYILQEGNTKLAPRYYLGQWISITDINIDDKNSFEQLKKDLLAKNKKDLPKFVLFYENRNLTDRVNTIKRIIPHLEYETTIEPGFMDKTLYKLNPKNQNQTIYIYKNTDTL